MSIEEKIHTLRGKAMTSGNGSHFMMYHRLRQDVESSAKIILPEVKKLEKENKRLRELVSKIKSLDHMPHNIVGLIQIYEDKLDKGGE